MSLSDTNNAGRAEFTTPLRESLLLLGNSTECHRVLIIFSDGERETSISTDLVKQYNSNREVGVVLIVLATPTGVELCPLLTLPGSGVFVPNGKWGG